MDMLAQFGYFTCLRPLGLLPVWLDLADDVSGLWPLT